MVNYAWGGYQNGQIPSAAMAIIPGTASFIKKDLLPGVVGLRAAFRAHFGYTLSIVEAYRSLAVQQALYSGWLKRQAGVPGYQNYNLAAYPGTSMHGWGLSIDFGSNVNTYGSAEKAWMDANAPRYGFLPTGNTFGPREAWHFDGIGTMTAGSTPSTPLPVVVPITEDRDMQLVYDINAPQNIYFAAPGHDLILVGGDDVDVLRRFIQGAPDEQGYTFAQLQRIKAFMLAIA